MEKPIQKSDFSEDDIAIQVATWLALNKVFFTHVPNEGKRSKANGAKLKKMGMLPGVSDYLIFEPRGKYHGAAMELKKVGGRPTEPQKQFIDMMVSKGYVAKICYGFDDAIDFLKGYLYGRA